jgi:hypothetical protein
MVEWLAATFAIGALGFWILLGILTFIILVAVAHDSGVSATVSVLITIIFFQWLGGFGSMAFQYAKENLWIVFIYAGGYLLIGLLWAIVKWWFLVSSYRRRYDSAKSRFLRQHSAEGSTIPNDLRDAWRKHVVDEDLGFRNRTYLSYESEASQVVSALVPDVTQEKASIIRWLTYWPWSMLWTLIDDPVKRFFNFLYEQIGAFMQAIADRVFRGVEADFDFSDKSASPSEEGESAE